MNLVLAVNSVSKYSLRSIKHVAKMDVSGQVLVSRYIHITDMFYGMEGVADTPTLPY
jgi:hypothetical protein